MERATSRRELLILALNPGQTLVLIAQGSARIRAVANPAAELLLSTIATIRESFQKRMYVSTVVRMVSASRALSSRLPARIGAEMVQLFQAAWIAMVAHCHQNA
jgi:hypothetical protein